MKFASVLVVLTIAVAVNAKPQFFGFNPYFGGYGVYPAFGAPYFAGTPAAFATARIESFDSDAEFIPGAIPATPAATVPVVPVAPFSGSYVAANRGSVHVAPLDGHVESVRSINTDPAPGTF